jgi:hypothetical protein
LLVSSVFVDDSFNKEKLRKIAVYLNRVCQPDDPLLLSKYEDFLIQKGVEFVRDPFAEEVHLKSGVSKN